MRRGALRVFYLWTAVFAVLTGALAPTITQAMQGRGDSSQFSICTQFGSRSIVSGTGSPSSRKTAPDSQQPDEHCPYCTLHAAGLGMPPVALEPRALPLSHAVHWRYSATTPTLALWSDALSRGPPPFA